jgi:hypothetical protein
MEEQIKLAPRVRYDDDEIGRIGRERDVYRHDRNRSRQSSVGSLSIHSAGGGARTVEPGTALPITYRTLSIEIDENQQRKQEVTKKAKEKGTIGTLCYNLLLASSSLISHVEQLSKVSTGTPSPSQSFPPAFPSTLLVASPSSKLRASSVSMARTR